MGNTTFKRNDIPVKWGIIIALVSIVVSTVLNMFVLKPDGMSGYYIGLALAFVIVIVMFVISAKQQRKAMGGFITLKESFRGMFISILIFTVITVAYQQIYINFIDPDFMLRMREATLNVTEKMGAPQEQLDKVAEDFDKQIKNSKSFSKQLLSVLWSIVLYSIVAFIIAAIVKKNKPVFDNHQ